MVNRPDNGLLIRSRYHIERLRVRQFQNFFVLLQLPLVTGDNSIHFTSVQGCFFLADTVVIHRGIRKIMFPRKAGKFQAPHIPRKQAHPHAVISRRVVRLITRIAFQSGHQHGTIRHRLFTVDILCRPFRSLLHSRDDINHAPVEQFKHILPALIITNVFIIKIRKPIDEMQIIITIAIAGSFLRHHVVPRHLVKAHPHGLPLRIELYLCFRHFIG